MRLLVHPEPYLGAPWVSSGLSGVIWVRTGGRQVLPESLGFIELRSGDRRVRPGKFGLLRCVLRDVGSIRGSWVHWGASWRSSGSSGGFGF